MEAYVYRGQGRGCHSPVPHRNKRDSEEVESTFSCRGQDRLCGREEHFRCFFKDRKFPKG